MQIWQTVLLIGTSVLIFDGIWAWVAQTKGIAYSKGIVVSLILYLLAGILTEQRENLLAGVISGFFVAGIDATIGWWISSMIGPGRLPEKISGKARIRTIGITVYIVMITGALFGLLGGYLQRFI